MLQNEQEIANMSAKSCQNVVLNMQWLEIFQPFLAVENLYLSKAFVPRIALALQELIGGRAVYDTTRMSFTGTI